MTHPPSSRFPLCRSVGLRPEQAEVFEKDVPVFSADEIEILLSEGVRVSGALFSKYNGQFTMEKQPSKADFPFELTHTALLINIKPIERAPRKREVTEDAIRTAISNNTCVGKSAIADILEELFAPRTEGSAG